MMPMTASASKARQAALRCASGVVGMKTKGKLPAFNPWGGAPKKWSNWTTEKAYGRYNPTAAVVRSGQGKSTAVWETELPSGGEYEVFVYHPGPALKRGIPRQLQERMKVGTTFSYVIQASGGDESVEFDPSRAGNGLEFSRYF